MAIARRSIDELLKIAAGYAAQRRAPAQVIIKELLHFDILEGMVLEGAMRSLVFQGGTCLRLCHDGNRYSEDLDFAGGPDFSPSSLNGLGDVIAKRLDQHYGLGVEVHERAERVDADGISVARWQARIQVPQADRSLPQKQVINLEVASVPAHDVDLLPVRARYPGITLGGRSLVVPAESGNEILADKIKAVVSRPFLKARDVWDIKFLLDRGERPNFNMVAAKVADYGWTMDRFFDALDTRVGDLGRPENEDRFNKEMTRFLDAAVSELLTPKITQKYLRATVDLLRATKAALASSPSPSM